MSTNQTPQNGLIVRGVLLVVENTNEERLQIYPGDADEKTKQLIWASAQKEMPVVDLLATKIAPEDFLDVIIWLINHNAIDRDKARRMVGFSQAQFNRVFPLKNPPQEV